MSTEWVSTTDRLPHSGTKVLVFFLNELGKGRTTTAHYAAKHTLEASHWEDEAATDCDDDGQSWQPEGWWEESVEGEYLHPLAHYDITHWMPLPERPATVELGP